MPAKRALTNLAVFAGPVLFLLCAIYGGDPVWRMAGIAIWMAVWWMSEPFDIAITSLLPFALLPICGIADARMVASAYMDPVIFLFLGGFLLLSLIHI